MSFQVFARQRETELAVPVLKMLAVMCPSANDEMPERSTLIFIAARVGRRPMPASQDLIRAIHGPLNARCGQRKPAAFRLSGFAALVQSQF